MPPPKKCNPKEEYFERGQRLLADAENSSDPVLKELRTKMAKRYFSADSLGAAAVSPHHVVFIGFLAIVVLAAIAFYAAMRLSGVVFGSVLVVCSFFSIIVVILMLALTGVMTENTVSKLLVNMWTKTLSKFGKASKAD
jgi:preprotein translocase subunit Sec61beta